MLSFVSDIPQTSFIICSFFFGVVFSMLFLEIPFSRRNTICFILFSAASLSIQLLLKDKYNTDSLYPLIVHALLFLMLVFVYHKRVLPSLTSILLCYSLTMPRYLIALLILYFAPDITGGDFTCRAIATIPMCLIVWFFMLHPMQAALKRSSHDIKIFFIPLLAVYVTGYIIFVYSDLLYRAPLLSMEIITTLALFLITYYVHLFFVIFDHNKELELHAQMLEATARSANEQIRLLQDANDDTRILRHDMKHFGTLVHEAAAKGSLDDVLKYTSAFDSKLNDTKLKKYCKNHAVDLILAAYLRPFYTNNTVITIQANVPESSAFPEADISTILANALDNAWNACEQMPSPELHIEINEMDNKFFIKISNSFRGVITFRDELPVSAKSGHGFGTKSISAIARKHHGLASFMAEDGIFTVTVVLHSVEA